MVEPKQIEDMSTRPQNFQDWISCKPRLFIELVKDGKYIGLDAVFQVLASYRNVTEGWISVDFYGEDSQISHFDIKRIISRAHNLGYHVNLWIGEYFEDKNPYINNVLRKYRSIIKYVKKNEPDDSLIKALGIDICTKYYTTANFFKNTVSYPSNIWLTGEIPGRIQRIKNRIFTYKHMISYWNKPKVCDYVQNSITILADNSIAVCPLNKSDEVKYKADAREDNFLNDIFLLEDNIKLRQKLITKNPPTSCKGICKLCHK